MSVFLAAAVFGLSAGFAPGPLMALVIAQTLRYGVKEGVLAAAAPILTDLPIITVSFIVLERLAQVGPAVGLISTLGGGYLFYLAYDTFKIEPVTLAEAANRPQSLKKGLIVNALNPHPYIFWITVGIPFILRALPGDPWAPLWFFPTFFGLLIGSKMALALIIGRFRSFLQGRIYLTIMRILALALAVLALRLFGDALVRFGLIT